MLKKKEREKESKRLIEEMKRKNERKKPEKETMVQKTGVQFQTRPLA